MMGATTAVAGASGIRAWLAAKGFAWMTARRMRFTTIFLLSTAVIGSSLGVSGT